jgi:hypothetical protein
LAAVNATITSADVLALGFAFGPSQPPSTIPAGSTASADFSTASGVLADTTVHHHPANHTDGASGTPVEISPDKTNGLPRAPTAST